MVPVIKAEALTHVYSAGTPFERYAITDVNFEADKGEIVGIIGHTGSGKSTLIQHLNGLLKPDSGKIFLHGEDIWRGNIKPRDVRFKVGLVFQYPEYQLFEETVFKDIAFGPRNMGLTESEVNDRVYMSAAIVGLKDEQLKMSPFELSGGQKRRAAIAGVFAMRPEVLILDEPTAGLDPKGRNNIMKNIREFHDSTGATIIMVSHSMEEIAANVDRIVVMNDGSVAMNGTPEQVFRRSEELIAMGLDVPMVTSVFIRLREMGLDVDPSVFTIEQAKAAILEMRRSASHA